MSLGVAVALVLTDCSQPATEENPPAPVTTDPATSFGHVHGLGMNPSDGAVYVATHQGLYTADDEAGARLVGTSRTDLMGASRSSTTTRSWPAAIQRQTILGRATWA
ncbi:hypothetical protein [Georgenia subflava]|uniref:Uncharacterized protein n=1 Tax=Georgenia subflava TaxID=1622177 RepID=A0A6N7ELB1_9MICO|nr:hypothetical protein [Georgenia subflava]MPV37878.1 hypothetical protein [Georgenia subflava]